jgi:ribosomal protein S25
MIESYFHNARTVHTFRKSGSVQRKPGSDRPKVRTEEHIETVQRQVKNELQLSLRQLSQETELSVSTCQRIVLKHLDDSVTAERYRNNILDVFINQLQRAQVYFQQDGTTARETLRYLKQFFYNRLIN